ncbi:unnamed protein product, partial [Heterotrigona itama]
IIHGSYIRHYSAVWYDTAALREHRSRSRRDTSASGHPGDGTLNLRLHALDSEKTRYFVQSVTSTILHSVISRRKRHTNDIALQDTLYKAYHKQHPTARYFVCKCEKINPLRSIDLKRRNVIHVNFKHKFEQVTEFLRGDELSFWKDVHIRVEKSFAISNALEPR